MTGGLDGAGLVARRSVSIGLLAGDLVAGGILAGGMLADDFVTDGLLTADPLAGNFVGAGSVVDRLSGGWSATGELADGGGLVGGGLVAARLANARLELGKLVAIGLVDRWFTRGGLEVGWDDRRLASLIIQRNRLRHSVGGGEF